MNNIVNKDIQLPVVGFDGKELRKITLDSEIFGIEPHMPSVHLAVIFNISSMIPSNIFIFKFYDFSSFYHRV